MWDQVQEPEKPANPGDQVKHTNGITWSLKIVVILIRDNSRLQLKLRV